MAEILPADIIGYTEAIRLLKTGALVALPTDTVYGLAGLAQNRTSIAEVYAVKNRPKGKALSVVIFTPEQAHELAHVSPLAQKLMNSFWPGALTLVLPTLKKAATIALRCPDIPWVKAFSDLGFTDPLVLPSANISDKPAPVTAGQISAEINDKVPLILDGGTCKARHESTIIAVDGERAELLRLGAIAPERFAAYNIEMGRFGLDKT